MEGLYLIFFHVQLYIEKTALYLMSTKFLKAKLIEYFYTSTDYGHLVSKMGSEYLPKLLSQHLESVIKAKKTGNYFPDK
ncbi:unnamed protein product [Lactuca virosa]|uniref:Uncharacterized protein n=1 Tax=Lactuca virosa TaxID=75947 RepID=A0AAU9N5Y0_9ASTR|nr:unnamed protein product [Lactuca virosa]